MNNVTATKENVKFQYLRPDEYHKEKNGLCITIGTQIYEQDNTTMLLWSCAFKNPKDQFSKEIARNIIINDFNQQSYFTLTLKKGDYTRHEILDKILMTLYVNSYAMLSDDYLVYVRKYLYM